MKLLRPLILGAVISLLAMIIGPLQPVATQALEKSLIQRATRASVQLGPLVLAKTRSGKNEIRPFGWGSGTLVEGGYIITNEHVANTEPIKKQLRGKAGFSVVEGKLLVFLTKRTDEPPVASYIADVLVSNEDLDLAVLQIRYDLRGEELDLRDLELPALDLGDSDNVEIGDTLNIFGYPGIGGETITFTSGPVSGFTAESGVARAWIKTSATIAGGNSGGTGVNDNGELIGIPTRGGSGDEKAGIVDCRPVQDTNGDGRIDKSDSCVAIGGFINALRAVNLAKPMLEAAQGGSSNNDDNNSGGGGSLRPDPKPRANSDGVIFTGKIVDASSGRGIPNAFFIVFKEGITLDTAEGTEEEIYVAAKTDRNGEFRIDTPVERGKTFSIAWVAKGYRPNGEDNVEITDSLPEELEVTLKLQKK
jgi:S1-C subfamily serine protease